MKHMVSKDNTPLAYEKRGNGPPLLLVHGSGIDHTYWETVTPQLERHFTVCAIDRRGRGQSGDSRSYAIQREFEDIAALIGNISGPVDVIGHSYGALCSLEAALLTRNIRRLVLYEPPIYTTIDIPYPADAPVLFNTYIKNGNYEKALLLLYKIGDAPVSELDLQKAQPNWQARLAATPTLAREAFGARGYNFSPNRFRNMETPTLLLVGSKTTPFYKAATEAVHRALPNSQVAVLHGQGHEAVVTAPELFLREVLNFLAH
ncbi:alpha/beta hydrolase [Candidatus Bathyarchaeota archaeon]|nr:alpha/beta hydrolase [Candidatus Bathyarchaeota archaeon]